MEMWFFLLNSFLAKKLSIVLYNYGTIAILRLLYMQLRQKDCNDGMFGIFYNKEKKENE